jgi:hypothetical protein
MVTRITIAYSILFGTLQSVSEDGVHSGPKLRATLARCAVFLLTDRIDQIDSREFILLWGLGNKFVDHICDPRSMLGKSERKAVCEILIGREKLAMPRRGPNGVQHATLFKISNKMPQERNRNILS